MKLKLGIGIAIVIIILLALNIDKFDNRSYVATIGKEKIYKEEFLIYLYDETDRFEKTGGTDIWNYTFDGSNAFDVAKNNALETLYVIKLSNILAKKENVTLTESDNQGIERIKKQFLEQIPDETLSKTNFESDNIDKVARENLLYLKTFNEVTKNFIFNDEEFNIYIEEQYNNIDYNYINDDEVVDNNTELDDSKREELRQTYIDKLKKDMFDKRLIALKDQYPLEINKNIWDSIVQTDSSLEK